MYRDHTKEVQIGNVTIGGGNPIRIQSMTNTKTEDVEATVAQILALEKAGCEIILIISWRLQRLRTGQIRFVLIRGILEMSRESVLLLKKQKSTVFQFVLV